MNIHCPACGAAQLVLDTRDLTHTDKAETATFPGMTGQFCTACDEAVLNADESACVSAAMPSFNKQVNASIMDPVFIASVRKKLALDQGEAAETFGGGANAFSHYRNGKTKPPLVMVKLLLVLDRPPELLGEVRFVQPTEAAQ